MTGPYIIRWILRISHKIDIVTSDNWAMLGAVKMEPEHYVYYNLLLAHPVYIRLLGPI